MVAKRTWTIRAWAMHLVLVNSERESGRDGDRERERERERRV